MLDPPRSRQPGLCALRRALGFVLAGAARAGAPFFNGVEYLPRDQREPAAQAFVAGAAPPGRPLSTAVADIRKAGAYCRPAASTSDVTCVSRSLEHNPGEHLDEVSWTVRITPDAAGNVVSASVVREKSGF
jgi:hypothetical protein